jgi:hypothetical protein
LNFAKLQYYSGHGHLDNPQLRGKIDCWDIDYDPKERSGFFGVDDIAPHINWKEELEYFIIVGCSVLAPAIYYDSNERRTKGWYGEDPSKNTSTGPGIHWATMTLRNPNLNNVGPLTGLCGYWEAGPADTERDANGNVISQRGTGVLIAEAFTKYLTTQVPPNHTGTGDRVLNAWLQANKDYDQVGIAYDRHNYWVWDSRAVVGGMKGPYSWE